MEAVRDKPAMDVIELLKKSHNYYRTRNSKKLGREQADEYTNRMALIRLKWLASKEW